MRQTRNFFLFLLLFSLFISKIAHSQIVLSEIMFDPSGNENYDEFIEIFNTSSTDSIDLGGWQINDGSGSDFIIPYQSNTKLAPHQFGLILDPGYFENSSHYDDLIPETALLLTIDNNTFGSSGLSNSNSEPVALISAAGDTVGKYSYSLDNNPGHSDEKIDLFAGDAASNWANSKTSRGTPGNFNTVRLMSYNISVELTALSYNVPSGESGTLTAVLKNLGSMPAADIPVLFFQDRDFNKIFEPEELIYQTTLTDTVYSTQSRPIEISVDSIASGEHLFQVWVDFSDDQDTSDNNDTTKICVGFAARSVIINEIMYRPASGQPEWIELFNPGSFSVTLQNWLFSDENFDNKIELDDSSLIIESHNFFIIAANNSILQSYPLIQCPVYIPSRGFPSLNNNGDIVILYDLIGSIIDQVDYLPEWGNEIGVSLERIHTDRASNDPTNWTSSLDSLGGTPGCKNSVTPKDYDLALTELIYSPQNPLPADEILIQCKIKNAGLLPSSGFLIQYYLDFNFDNFFKPDELIGGTVSESQIIEPDDSLCVAFNYVVENSGIFKLCAEIIFEDDPIQTNDSLSTKLGIGFVKNSIIINEIMYAPANGKPEWVELYNPSSNTVDLQSWSFSDSDSSSPIKLADQHLYIQPNSYFVLSQYYSLPYYFNNENINFAVFSNFPRLNNSTDFIFLFDGNKNIIDKVQYWDAWNGKEDFSLERINPGLGSNDSSNWSSSVNLRGGTPGKQNSIFVDVLPADAELFISPNPFSPDEDGRDDITIITYQLPFNLSQVNLKIYDIRGRLVRSLANNQPSAVNNSTIWNGKDNDGHVCRMGIYIVFLEAIQYNEGVVRTLKKSVVLAKQL